MCSPSPPPPTDFNAAANAQGAANRETAIAQGHINNPNVNNPYGSQTVTWDGEQPTITQTLSPDQQALLDQRTGVQRALGGLAGQGAQSLQGLIGTQVDFGGMPSRATALGYRPNSNPAARAPTGNPAGNPRMMGAPAAEDSMQFGRRPILKAAPAMAPASPDSAPGKLVQSATQNNGTFLDDYRAQGSDYGGKASNFTGIDPNTGQQFINGHLFAAQGNTDSGDRGTPGKTFQDVLNNYADQISQITGQSPSTTAPNPLPIPGGPPNPEPNPAGGNPAGGGPPPGGPAGDPGGNPARRGPGLPPIGTGGDAPSAYGDINLPTVQDIPGALNPNGLPGMGRALDSRFLPPVNSAETTRQNVINAMMGRTNTDLQKQTDQMNSDLIARGIHPGTEAYSREQDMIARSRNDARQQAEIAGGNAAAQQSGIDLANRQQATGEQAQTFGQRTTNRGIGASEQAQRFQQALTGGGQKFAQQGQLSQLQSQLQQQGFGQETSNRRDAIAELLAQRQTPLNEITALMGGSQVSNPFSVPGYAQNTSVAPPPIFGAAQAQSNANNNVYNAQAGSANSTNGAIAGLGSAAMMATMMF